METFVALLMLQGVTVVDLIEFRYVHADANVDAHAHAHEYAHARAHARAHACAFPSSVMLKQSFWSPPPALPHYFISFSSLSRSASAGPHLSHCLA